MDEETGLAVKNSTITLILLLVLILTALFTGRLIGLWEACNKTGAVLTEYKTCWFEDIRDWVHYEQYNKEFFDEDSTKSNFWKLSQDGILFNETSGEWVYG